jgi:RNA polymerase sigma-32 factor
LGSIEAYIQAIYRIPMLSQEDETRLATQFIKTNDLNAARALVMAHLRFVVKVAKGYAGYGLSQADLIQEGSIGLMKAVKRFDPTLGVRLVSFAVHWIKAEIHEFIIRNWRIVKVATTKAQRKLFFNLRNAKKRLGWFTHEEVSAVAKTLSVSTKEVLEMEQRLNAYHDISFEHNNEEDDACSLVPAHYLEDKQADPSLQLEETDWSSQNNDSLHTALQALDERSRHILNARWLTEKKSTLQALAQHFGLSLERIRQLEKSAMEKLKVALEAK